MAAVSKRPVLAVIRADSDEFRFYSHGVFEGICGTELNHAVLIVGYGIDAETRMPYWLVQNSWGQQWGEEGYIRLLRQEEGVGTGTCGIAIRPSYPRVFPVEPEPLI